MQTAAGFPANGFSVKASTWVMLCPIWLHTPDPAQAALPVAGTITYHITCSGYPVLFMPKAMPPTVIWSSRTSSGEG